MFLLATLTPYENIHGVVVLGDLAVACLPLDPRFAGSNLTEDDGLLRAINISSTISIGR
jgi:hypothetical protein